VYVGRGKKKKCRIVDFIIDYRLAVWMWVNGLLMVMHIVHTYTTYIYGSPTADQEAR